VSETSPIELRTNDISETMSPESPRLFIRMGLPSALRSDIGQGETGVTGGSAVMTLARLAVNHRGPRPGAGAWERPMGFSFANFPLPAWSFRSQTQSIRLQVFPHDDR
jgi:hypothetical protein